MFDKQMLEQIEKMVGKLKPSQKEKLANILKDEESIKKALSGVDPAKAKKVVENLKIDGVSSKEINQMAEKLTQKPQAIGENDEK